MTVRRELSKAEREHAAECLRASAAANDGKPDWSSCATMTGRDPKVLRRIWLEIGQGAPPERTASAPTDPTTAPLLMSDVEWWAWRWAQHQAEIARAESDVAREKLLRAQDDLRASYRTAVEVESKKTGRTAEEIAARLERAAETMPPAVAARVVGVLRRRGLAG